MQLNHHRGGTGETLVLIHGIGSRWQVWAPVLPRLESVRDVVAFDLPGFAASPPPPPGTPPGVSSLTSLVAEFLDELGLERPHVAGNSLGGWIALELAKQNRVRSATALSPAGFQNSPEAVFQRTSLWLGVRGARLLARASHPEKVLARPRARRLVLGQYVAAPERLPVDDAVQTVRALAQAEWFDESLAAINKERFRGGEQTMVPVTIAWGERDRLLLPHQARRAARMIPGARVLTLSGCGHVPTYDDPEQVADVLLQASSR